MPPTLRLSITHSPHVKEIPSCLCVELCEGDVDAASSWIYDPGTRFSVVVSPAPAAIQRGVTDHAGHT